MRSVSIRKAYRPLGEYASELKGDIVVVTKGRKAVAALVPLKNVDPESLALSTDPDFIELIARARKEFASGKTLSLAEVKSRVLGGRSRKRHRPAPRRRKVAG